MNHTFSMETEEEDDSELGKICAEILENWNSPIYTPHQNPFSLKRDATYLESDISMSKLKYKHSSELEHKDNRNEPSIIPVLIADTFFDKLLQRYVDGVNIASLSNAHEKEDESSTVSANNGKRTVSSLFKPNFPTVNKMQKRSPISGENRHMQGTSINYIRRSYIFVLPPRKTIFDVDIDEIGEKMWRNPGVNLSDFFNYGLDEKQWKDYCKMMQGQMPVRSFRRRKVEDESTQSFKIAMNNSFYENDIRRQNIKYNGVSTAGPYQRNTPYMNCRMINGDKKISPFSRDSSSDEEGEWKEEQSQQYYDAHFTKLSRERKSDTDLLSSHSEVELTGTETDEMGKKQSSRKQEEHSPSQRNLKSARLFYKGNQTSYHNGNLYLDESLCSQRVESVREKIEYYASQGVQNEYANRTFPTNIYNSRTKMEVEEYTEKLKRRREGFNSPLPTLENVVADTYQ